MLTRLEKKIWYDFINNSLRSSLKIEYVVKVISLWKCANICKVDKVLTDCIWTQKGNLMHWNKFSSVYIRKWNFGHVIQIFRAVKSDNCWSINYDHLICHIYRRISYISYLNFLKTLYSFKSSLCLMNRLIGKSIWILWKSQLI